MLGPHRRVGCVIRQAQHECSSTNPITGTLSSNSVVRSQETEHEQCMQAVQCAWQWTVESSWSCWCFQILWCWDENCQLHKVGESESAWKPKGASTECHWLKIEIEIDRSKTFGGGSLWTNKTEIGMNGTKLSNELWVEGYFQEIQMWMRVVVLAMVVEGGVRF